VTWADLLWGPARLRSNGLARRTIARIRDEVISLPRELLVEVLASAITKGMPGSDGN
jgi:hypothetical protein